MPGPTTTFQVRYRISGTSVWTNYGVPATELNKNISGLQPDTEYELEIIATNLQGSVVSSRQVFTTGSTPLSPPGMPIASNITPTSMILNWSPPDTGSLPILYQLMYRVSGVGSYADFGTSSGNLSSAISGLAGSTAYDFRVDASNSSGTESSPVLTISTAIAGTAPSAPTTVNATNVTATTLTLTWGSSTGTAPITYQSKYRVSGIGAYVDIGAPIADATKAVTGLTAATNYDFIVDAINSVGTTSSVVLTIPTASAVVAPTAPTGLVASSITQTGMIISWVASGVGTPAPTYQMQYRIGASGSFANFGAPISILSLSIPGLAIGTTYNFRIVATNSAGSATSSTLSAATLAASVAPSAPLNVGSGTITSTTIPVTWTAPAQGTAPLTYVLQWRQSP